MIDTAKPCLRLIRGGRTANDDRQTVDLYRHDTGEVRSVVWTLPQLLAGIRRRRPRRSGETEWTFSIGRRRVLVIATEGPGKFRGNLTLEEVERLAREFYIEVCDLPCHRRGSS